MCEEAFSSPLSISIARVVRVHVYTALQTRVANLCKENIALGEPRYPYKFFFTGNRNRKKKKNKIYKVGGRNNNRLEKTILIIIFTKETYSEENKNAISPALFSPKRISFFNNTKFYFYASKVWLSFGRRLLLLVKDGTHTFGSCSGKGGERRAGGGTHTHRSVGRSLVEEKSRLKRQGNASSVHGRGKVVGKAVAGSLRLCLSSRGWTEMPKQRGGRPCYSRSIPKATTNQPQPTFPYYLCPTRRSHLFFSFFFFKILIPTTDGIK